MESGLNDVMFIHPLQFKGNFVKPNQTNIHGHVNLQQM